jgi:hypothetical protein
VCPGRFEYGGERERKREREKTWLVSAVMLPSF